MSSSQCDKPAEVSEEEQASATSQLGLSLSARTSARTGEGIAEAFETLIIKVYDSDKAKGKPRSGSSISLDSSKFNRVGGGC